MELIRKENSVEITFENPDEIYDFIKDTPKKNHSRDTMGKSFCPYSWDDSISALRNGWEEGVKNISLIAEKINCRMKPREDVQYHHEEVGQILDVGEYLTGSPECWLEPDVVEVKKEVVSIMVNLGAPWSVSSEAIQNRGAAITSLIDRLYDNYFIELAFEMNVIGIVQKNLLFRVNMDVKNNYSRNVVAFYTAHPAMLRRVMFSTAEKLFDRSECGGYGSAGRSEESMYDITFQKLDSDDGFRTIEEAASTVEKYIDKLEAKNKK